MEWIYLSVWSFGFKICNILNVFLCLLETTCNRYVLFNFHSVKWQILHVHVPIR
jgi:hypothetical protein